MNANENGPIVQPEMKDCLETKASNNYRDAALKAYSKKQCAYCGFGIEAVLEVAHLDQNRKNNLLDNLAVLCPNCHKMHDLGLIPTDVILKMRDLKNDPDWKMRMKDAAQKAAATRKANTAKNKKSVAGKRAWITRSKNTDGEPQ